MKPDNWFDKHNKAIYGLLDCASSLRSLADAFRVTGNKDTWDNLNFYANIIENRANLAKEAVSEYIDTEVKAQEKQFGEVMSALASVATKKGD